MPQYLNKITQAQAKRWYGFVINPALPFNAKDEFKLEKSGSTVPPVFPEIQPEIPSKNNHRDMF